MIARRKTSRLDCLFSARAGWTRMTRTRAATPQQERSRATQARLLEATVECLVEHGWSGTTTTVVAERAGVSRGAQLHHYPTRAALVTGRRRAPGRAPGRRDPRRGRGPAGDRPATGSTGWSTCSPPRSPARCSSPRSRCGSPPAPTPSCATRSCRWRRGSAARCTGSPSTCSAPTSARPAYARRCRPRSTCCAGSAWPTCSPTTPPAAPRCSPPGSASSPPSCDR